MRLAYAKHSLLIGRDIDAKPCQALFPAVPSCDEPEARILWSLAVSRGDELRDEPFRDEPEDQRRNIQVSYSFANHI